MLRLNLRYGDTVLRTLRRAFLSELQSKYGNMFTVREQVARCPNPLH